MELHHLRYFLKVAETLHFTKAADTLFVTQPALSQQIKQLEEELGVPLFSRNGKKIKLTDAGNIFLNYAKTSVLEVEKGERAISNFVKDVQGNIHVGVMYSYFSPLLAILSNFCKKYPKVNVILEYGNNEDLQEKLLSSKLDLALTFEGLEIMDDLEIKGSFNTQLQLAVNPKHELATQKVFTMTDLPNYLLALPVKGNIIRVVVDNYLKVNKINAQIHAEVNDLQLLLDIVEAGDFVTIVTNTASSKRKNIKLIPLKEQLQSPKGVVVVPKNGYLNKASNLFLEALLTQIQ